MTPGTRRFPKADFLGTKVKKATGKELKNQTFRKIKETHKQMY